MGVGKMKRITFVAILFSLAVLSFRIPAVNEALFAADAAGGAAAPSDQKLYDVSLGKGAISLEDLAVFIRDTLKIQIIYDRRIFSGDGVNYVVNVKPMTAEELLPFLRDTLQRYGYNIASVGAADKSIYYIYKTEGQPGARRKAEG